MDGAMHRDVQVPRSTWMCRSGVPESGRPRGRAKARPKLLRLPQHLLDSIKSAAHARDVPYQSLIKVWLQEKLNGH